MATDATFQEFKVERVLSHDPKTKSTAVLGRYKGREGQAVVQLFHRPFDYEQLPVLLSPAIATELLFQNDIYAKYTCIIPEGLGRINIDVIYPATEKHIIKHTDQQSFMVSESPDEYRDITLPYIEAIPQARLQWVYNILQKKAEADRLVLEDTRPDVGFVLHPDMHWDQAQIKELHCIAIVHRRDIRSVRDLQQEHLPLLRNVKEKAVQALVERYGVKPEELRVYMHYQPSYYHLHMHFLHVGCDAGAGMAAGKAHLLDDVIDNIALVPDYYQRRTLSFVLGERDPLLQAFRNCKALAAAAARAAVG